MFYLDGNIPLVNDVLICGLFREGQTDSQLLHVNWQPINPNSIHLMLYIAAFTYPSDTCVKFKLCSFRFFFIVFEMFKEVIIYISACRPLSKIMILVYF